MKRFPLYVIAALLALVSTTGCGGDAPEATDGEQVTGAVRIDGSSTVFPITEAVAEEFMLANPEARVTVGVSGTGGGFAKFLRSEIDINDASRPIKASEVALAQQNGVGYIELPVAYDGIAVVTHPGNDFVDCLTTDELNKIWAPGSTVDNWRQVRDGFPDRPLTLYGPGTDSGTYDYFTEAIGGEGGASRSDFTASEDDNVLVQGLAGDPDALGFFGLAYYEENQDKLKLLGVDDGDAANGDGCVQPTTATVGDGTYQPLARPVFIYVNTAGADKPAVEAFVTFYLAQADALTREVGYVPLSEEAYQLTLNRYRNRTTGSLFGTSQAGQPLEALLRGGAPPPAPAAADTTAAAR